MARPSVLPSLLMAAVAGSCQPSSGVAAPLPDLPIELSQALFTADGIPETGYPSIAFLRLEADGGYAACVMNGMTAGGCGMFTGAGSSAGRWVNVDGEIEFEPMEEPPDLALSFAGATARWTGGELVLRTAGVDRRMITREDLDLSLGAWGLDGESR